MKRERSEAGNVLRSKAFDELFPAWLVEIAVTTGQRFTFLNPIVNAGQPKASTYLVLKQRQWHEGEFACSIRYLRTDFTIDPFGLKSLSEINSVEKLGRYDGMRTQGMREIVALPTCGNKVLLPINRIGGKGDLTLGDSNLGERKIKALVLDVEGKLKTISRPEGNSI